MVTTRSQESHHTAPPTAEAPASPAGTPRRSNRNRGGVSPKRQQSPQGIEDTIEVNPDRYRLGPASPSAASDHSVKEKLKKTSINPGGSSQRSVDSSMQKSTDDNDGEDESMGSSPGGSGGSSPTGRKRTYEDSNEGSQEENDTKERMANSPPPRKREFQPDNVSNVLKKSNELAMLTQDASGSDIGASEAKDNATNGRDGAHEAGDTAMQDEVGNDQPLERKKRKPSTTIDEYAESNAKGTDDLPRGKKSRDLTNESTKAPKEAVDTDISDAPVDSSSLTEKKSLEDDLDTPNSAEKHVADENIEADEDTEKSKTASSANIAVEPTDAEEKPENKPIFGDGFKNTSSTSPFATAKPATSQSSNAPSWLSGSNTSTSASPFGAVTGQGSAASPFGGLGGGLGGGLAGGFGGGSSGSPFGQSPFGSTSAGAKNIFSSGPTTTFKPVAVVPLGSGPKPSDTAGSDAGDSDDNNEAETDKDKDKEKEREPEKPIYREDGTKVIAGEEHENVLKQARVKMYQKEGDGWKERGTGTLKLLVERDDEESSTAATEDKDNGDDENKNHHQKARIVMRQEGVGRVLLNSRLFTGMLEEAEPINQFLRIVSVDEAGKNSIMLLKFINVNFSKEMFQLLSRLIAQCS